MKTKSQRILSCLSNDNQKEIYRWLVHHYSAPLTPIGTWQMLFRERDGKHPDKCISLYDRLPYDEKIEVELAFFEFAISVTKKSKQVTLF